MSTEILMGTANEEPATGQESTEIYPNQSLANNIFRVVYQTNSFSLPQITNLIDKGMVLNLRPEYQRRLRWSGPQKSRLIESLLLNVPLPPIFLYESYEAKYEVVDGQQRMNAIKEFFSGEFKLSGLSILGPLDGLEYSTLPPRFRVTLSRASLSTVVFLLESDSDRIVNQTFTLKDIRRFIFDRLNTGGTKLNHQEIRTALNPGVLNDTLVEITRLPIFTSVFKIPPYIESDQNDYYGDPQRRENTLYSTMGDCELALRYFALRDERNIRGSMKSMLDRAMEMKISDKEGAAMKDDYGKRLDLLCMIFDKRPFRLAPTEQGHQRISAAIYDALMVGIDDLWDEREKVRNDKAGVQRRMSQALENEDTSTILTGQQNTPKSIRGRIELARHILLS